MQLFYSNPNRSFYVREITRKIDEQINSVRRELSNLLNVGIISSENTNNRLYYEVNKDFQYYKPLSEIFADAAAVSSGDPDEKSAPLRALGNVELALYTGQFTRDLRSGVDFLVVGDINQTQLSKYVSELEQKEGKEIRYAVMNRDEFVYRRQVNDRFLVQVLESKKQVLVDKDFLLEKVEPQDTTAGGAEAKSEEPKPAAKKERVKK